MNPLLVREDQRRVFRAEAMRDFEDRMVAHLFVFSPEHCRGVGKAVVLETVRAGIRKAADYGFVRRGPVRLFLEASWLLGSEFDSDPLLPTDLRAPLEDRSGTSEMDRARAFHIGLVMHMRQVLGPANGFARAALDRMASLDSRQLAAQGPPSHYRVLQLLETTYPQRFALLPGAKGVALVASAIRAARRLDLAPERGTWVCAFLIFELGHGCFDDPLLPWLSAALGRRPGDTPEQRVDRLERKAGAYRALVARRLRRVSGS